MRDSRNRHDRVTATDDRCPRDAVYWRRRAVTVLLTRLVGATLLFALSFSLPLSSIAGAGRYLELNDYLQSVFPAKVPDPSNLVVVPELRREIERVSGDRFTRLRIRYWSDSHTTAWVLDEIGKTEPITIGVSVTDGQVGTVQVLEFRESRGWEVRYPFFTDQFSGARLGAGDDLDRPVDGITGATLSVAAVSRAVKLALMLDSRVQHRRDTWQAARGAP